MGYFLLPSLHFLVYVAAGSQEYVAFDDAGASSTYSAGNLQGSPAFAAQQALSGGSGYWCSSGSHAPGQSVIWTGTLNSRHVALGLRLDWAYSPGEFKVLTSGDGANFEEALSWKSSTRAEVSFVDYLMFDGPANIKAVMVAMRSPHKWGYYGINSATLVAEPGSFMLVSGITSPRGELCLVSGLSAVTLEPCLEAIAAGDGRDIFRFDQDGQIRSQVDDTCLTLEDGDATAGGALTMEACSAAAEAGDGRSVFLLKSNGQLQMPRLGDFCLSMAGDGAVEANVALGADVAATSSNAQHAAKGAIDGDDHSFWASAVDPASSVDMNIDFGATKIFRTVEIDWEYPAQVFELQIAQGGIWSSIVSVVGNNLKQYRYHSPGVAGSALRIRMTKPHPTFANADGHALYGIKDLRVFATAMRFVVQDCSEAEDNGDARDKFFMTAVPDFDQSAPLVAKQSAELLTAAADRLGALLASLYSAAPTLAACGFDASFAARTPQTSFAHVAYPPAESFGQKSLVQEGDATVAVAAIANAIGLDLPGLQELLAGAQKEIYFISH